LGEGGSGARTHHEGVDEDVAVLEGVECGRGGDAVLAALAELEPRHDGGERGEHRVVERLHRRPDGAERGGGSGIDSIGGVDLYARCGPSPLDSGQAGQ
jgi:hypothetical protein